MPTLFERAFFASGIIFAAQQIFGAALPCDQWSGTASSAKERTEVIISLCKDGAKLSLPRVGVQDWPALTRTANGDQIQLVFPSDSGAQRMQLMIADDKIQGTWSDPRFVDDAVLAMTKTTARPAFQEQSVLITGAAGKIGASLIIPDGGGPFPGVVFLHGSGPQLRDASRFQAQALANRGVASLIYDKRGVGQSTGPKTRSAFSDLATDAISAAEFLQAQENISSVGFYGHSQGGWVAPLAASRWSPTAFVITSSGPLVNPARESQWDTVRTMRKAGFKEAEIEKARAVIDQWYESMKRNNRAEFDRAMQRVRVEPWFSVSGLSQFAEPIDATTQATYLLDHDYEPLLALRKVTAPVLWILSKDDESIDAMETSALVGNEVALGRNIRIKMYSGYDHSLRQLDAKGVSMRWPKLPDDLFEVQAEFIKQTTAKPQQN